MNNLQILVTNKCSNPCKFCHFSCGPDGIELSAAKIDAIVRETRELGIKSLTYNGGEPMEHSEFAKLLEIAHKYDHQPSIITNGLYYSRYRSLFDKYKCSFWFGLDGMKKKTHDSIRVPGSFEKVMKAIIDSKKSGFFTAVNFVVTKQNVSELANFFNFVDKNKIDAIQVIKLTHDGRAKDTIDMDVNINQVAAIVKENMPRSRINNQFSGVSNSCSHLSLNTINVDWRGRINICSLSAQFEMPLPSVIKLGLSKSIDKLRKINERFGSVSSCEDCLERFQNPKDVFGMKCGIEPEDVNSKECIKCRYLMRGQCCVEQLYLHEN